MLQYDYLSQLHIARETGFAFYFDISQIINRFLPNCSEKGMEKLNVGDM